MHSHPRRDIPGDPRLPRPIPILPWVNKRYLSSQISNIQRQPVVLSSFQVLYHAQERFCARPKQGIQGPAPAYCAPETVCDPACLARNSLLPITELGGIVYLCDVCWRYSTYTLDSCKVVSKMACVRPQPC
jgi:hypothetical protein